MVVRAERNCQTFSPLKHTSLYKQVKFLLTLSWDTEGRDRLGDFPAGRVSERVGTGPTSSSASLIESRVEWGIEVAFHLAKQEFAVWEQKRDNFFFAANCKTALFKEHLLVFPVCSFGPLPLRKCPVDISVSSSRELPFSLAKLQYYVLSPQVNSMRA